MTDNAYQEVGSEGEYRTINFTTEIVLGMGYPPGHDFELTLKTLASQENSPCGSNSFKIEMLLKDKTNNTEKYLQKDSDVPKDRDCPLAYGIQYIYLYKNSLIIFLNTYIQGFETRNAQYMAVTGKVALD